MSGRSSAVVRLPSETWRNQHMLRAWRTCDFRTIFLLACKVGLAPENSAASTGLPLDLVLNVIKGNATLSTDSGQHQAVADGFGMPQDIRGVLGLALVKPNRPAPTPLTLDDNTRKPAETQPTAIKLRGHVGQRIADLRQQCGLTQEQLAERAGISLAMVSKLEQHARTPSLAMLDSVAKTLDVPASELLEPPLHRESPGRKRYRAPDYLPAEVLGKVEFGEACARRDLGAVFTIAERSGFSRSHLARRCEMTVGQVSAYMQGARIAQDVEIFCRVSDGLHIPGQMIGVGRREWESENVAPSPGFEAALPTDILDNGISKSERNCSGCGRSLSRYNKNKYCASCALSDQRLNQNDVDADTAVSDMGARLRAARERRGMPLHVLAGMCNISAAYVSMLENGKRRLDRYSTIVALANALRISPAELAPGLPESSFSNSDGNTESQTEIESLPAVTPDDDDRMVWAARKPTLADAGIVDPLTRMLAAQREAEDFAGSAVFIGPVVAQLATIGKIVIDARGKARPQILDVAAQWAEYGGWLHTSAGDGTHARDWFDRALEWATDAGNTTLVATTLSFKGHLAFLQGNVGPMLGLTQAAQRDRSIWIGQLAFDAHQEALALALMGEAEAAIRKVDEGTELALRANERVATWPPWAYYYTLPLYTAERGLVYRYLGRDSRAHNELAVTTLNSALEDMGEARSAEWAGEYIYHLAAAYMRAGSPDMAVRSAMEILEIARSKESELLLERICRLYGRLTERWPSEPSVIELGQALTRGALDC